MATRPLALSLADEYAAATPFPHIVIDDAFDRDRVKAVAAEVRLAGTTALAEGYAQRRKSAVSDLSRMGTATAALIEEMNSPAFVGWLERLTGIADLQPDPTLFGGGVHSIARGGFLKLHADFNWHRALRLHRRVNVLLYLNEGWREEWGGALELWPEDMSECGARVSPVLNRMVVFSTTDTSYHGHPEPLACPEHVTRNSIALYYYSAEPAGAHPGNVVTNYRPRRGERLGMKHRAHQLMIRFPGLQRLIHR